MSAASIRSRIAELNDQFRSRAGGPVAHSAGHVPGQLFVTPGIADLDFRQLGTVLERVRTFSTFNEGNDPYGEHDFGSLDVNGLGEIFWKIDYYGDARCESGAEDPSDPQKSFRVLTVMLAEEY